MNALVIARHHLHRIVRSPGLILILLAIPITLALIEYAAFGPTVASGRLPPIKVLILDEDTSLASGVVPQIFTGGGPLKDMFVTATVADRATAQQQFQRNDASALVVVPRGFQQALLAGGRADLQFAPNPLQTFSPDIARSVLDTATLVGNGLYRQAIAPIERLRSLQAANREPTAQDVADVARGFFEAGQRLNGLSALNNVSVTIVRPDARPERPGVNAQAFFAFIFPGLVIFGVMFISQSLALRLLRDRIRGVDRRVRMTPVSAGAQVTGSFAFMIVGLLVLLALLMGVGAIVFRIPLRHPPALLLLGVGFAIFAACLHLAIIGVARDDRSASFIGSGVVMLLSLLGGSFVPAENFPPFLRTIAFGLPNGAAQQGLVDVLGHGRTLAEASARVVVTWGWAMGMMLIAVLAARRRSGRP
jgi:ABC-type multidrug transport system permease subunit